MQRVRHVLKVQCARKVQCILKEQFVPRVLRVLLPHQLQQTSLMPRM